MERVQLNLRSFGMGVVIGALSRLATPKPGWTVMGKPTTMAVMPPRGLSRSERGQRARVCYGSGLEVLLGGAPYQHGPETIRGTAVSS